MRKHIYRMMAVLAVLLVLCVHMGSAYAYFTMYTQAEGGYPIHLGGKGEINEKVAEWTKFVTITADEDSQPIFVRVKAYCRSDMALIYDDADGWTLKDDEFAYYANPIEAGQSTSELKIHIDKIPAEAVEGDSFNVIVVYETTPVQYDESGNAVANWNQTLTVVPEDE